MAVGLLLILLGYGFYQDPRYIPSPLVGRAAPDFSMELFNGETVRLSELRGKTLLLDFWASWCLPCRAEARDLEAAWKQQGGDVVFLGINIQDKEADARKFIEEFGITFANGRDPEGKSIGGLRRLGHSGSLLHQPHRSGSPTSTWAPFHPSLLAAKLLDARRDVASAESGRGEHQAIR